MANRKLPSQEVIRQLLRYEPETGKLFWRERGVEWFKDPSYQKRWNDRYADKPAFTALDRGYRVGALSAVGISREYAHRIAWVYMHGPIKGDLFVDHIDGDKGNNRASNLRLVSAAESLKNMPRRRDNASGATGVYWCARDKCFYAHIRVDGKTVNLGSFRCQLPAVVARKRAEKALNFSPNHGRAA